MGYILGIDVPGAMPLPSLRFDDLTTARRVVRDAIKDGRFVFEGGVTVQTGPGTIYKILNEDRLKEQETRSAAPSALEGTVVITQLNGAQLPPMAFATPEDARDAVRAATGKAKVFQHRIGDDEHTYIETTVGAVYMEMSADAFNARQEEARRASLAQQTPPLIVTPGGR